MLRTFLRWFVVTVVCAVGVPLVSGVTILASLLFLPLPATLPNPKPGIVSLPEHRVRRRRQRHRHLPSSSTRACRCQEKDIPQVLKDALVASEDKNFYHEGGVDPRGTLRAFVRDLQGQGYLQGGSTITQQYVDLAYTGQQRTLTRKLRQAILASQLARKLPKDEILYRYLNAVYLGDGCYGVGAASESYFHKPVQDLNVGEAALLVGLIPAPSRYEPRGNQVLAEDRRQTVLLKMYQQHYITLDAVPVLEGGAGLRIERRPSCRPAPPRRSSTPPSSRPPSTRTSSTTSGGTSSSNPASVPTCSTAAG